MSESGVRPSAVYGLRSDGFRRMGFGAHGACTAKARYATSDACATYTSDTAYRTSNERYRGDGEGRGKGRGDVLGGKGTRRGGEGRGGEGR